jgi:hypothetical protein
MAQPWKGDRKQVATRLLRPAATEVERRAKNLGMSITDYLEDLVLRELAKPASAPVRPKHEELDFPTKQTA